MNPSKPKKKRIAKYLHTIDWQPATFHARDGKLSLVGGRCAATLRNTLYEIREDQLRHYRWCEENFVRTDIHRLGYVLVYAD